MYCHYVSASTLRSTDPRLQKHPQADKVKVPKSTVEAPQNDEQTEPQSEIKSDNLCVKEGVPDKSLPVFLPDGGMSLQSHLSVSDENTEAVTGEASGESPGGAGDPDSGEHESSAVSSKSSGLDSVSPVISSESPVLTSDSTALPSDLIAPVSASPVLSSASAALTSESTALTSDSTALASSSPAFTSESPTALTSASTTLASKMPALISKSTYLASDIHTKSHIAPEESEVKTLLPEDVSDDDNRPPLEDVGHDSPGVSMERLQVTEHNTETSHDSCDRNTCVPVSRGKVWSCRSVSVSIANPEFDGGEEESLPVDASSNRDIRMSYAPSTKVNGDKGALLPSLSKEKAPTTGDGHLPVWDISADCQRDTSASVPPSHRNKSVLESDGGLGCDGNTQTRTSRGKTARSGNSLLNCDEVPTPGANVSSEDNTLYVASPVNTNSPKESSVLSSKISSTGNQSSHTSSVILKMSTNKKSAASDQSGLSYQSQFLTFASNLSILNENRASSLMSDAALTCNDDAAVSLSKIASGRKGSLPTSGGDENCDSEASSSETCTPALSNGDASFEISDHVTSVEHEGSVENISTSCDAQSDSRADSVCVVRDGTEENPVNYLCRTGKKHENDVCPDGIEMQKYIAGGVHVSENRVEEHTISCSAPALGESLSLKENANFTTSQESQGNNFSGFLPSPEKENMVRKCSVVLVRAQTTNTMQQQLHRQSKLVKRISSPRPVSVKAPQRLRRCSESYGGLWKQKTAKGGVKKEPKQLKSKKSKFNLLRDISLSHGKRLVARGLKRAGRKNSVKTSLRSQSPTQTDQTCPGKGRSLDQICCRQILQNSFVVLNRVDPPQGKTGLHIKPCKSDSTEQSQNVSFRSRNGRLGNCENLSPQCKKGLVIAKSQEISPQTKKRQGRRILLSLEANSQLCRECSVVLHPIQTNCAKGRRGLSDIRPVSKSLQTRHQQDRFKLPASVTAKPKDVRDCVVVLDRQPIIGAQRIGPAKTMPFVHSSRKISSEPVQNTKSPRFSRHEATEKGLLDCVVVLSQQDLQKPRENQKSKDQGLTLIHSQTVQFPVGAGHLFSTRARNLQTKLSRLYDNSSHFQQCSVVLSRMHKPSFEFSRSASEHHQLMTRRGRSSCRSAYTPPDSCNLKDCSVVLYRIEEKAHKSCSNSPDLLVDGERNVLHKTQPHRLACKRLAVDEEPVLKKRGQSRKRVFGKSCQAHEESGWTKQQPLRYLSLALGPDLHLKECSVHLDRQLEIVASNGEERIGKQLPGLRLSRAQSVKQHRGPQWPDDEQFVDAGDFADQEFQEPVKKRRRGRPCKIEAQTADTEYVAFAESEYQEAVKRHRRGRPRKTHKEQNISPRYSDPRKPVLERAQDLPGERPVVFETVPSLEIQDLMKYRRPQSQPGEHTVAAKSDSRGPAMMHRACEWTLKRHNFAAAEELPSSEIPQPGRKRGRPRKIHKSQQAASEIIPRKEGRKPFKKHGRPHKTPKNRKVASEILQVIEEEKPCRNQGRPHMTPEKQAHVSEILPVIEQEASPKNHGRSSKTPQKQTLVSETLPVIEQEMLSKNHGRPCMIPEKQAHVSKILPVIEQETSPKNNERPCMTPQEQALVSETLPVIDQETLPKTHGRPHMTPQKQMLDSEILPVKEKKMPSRKRGRPLKTPRKPKITLKVLPIIEKETPSRKQGRPRKTPKKQKATAGIPAVKEEKMPPRKCGKPKKVSEQQSVAAVHELESSQTQHTQLVGNQMSAAGLWANPLLVAANTEPSSTLAGPVLSLSKAAPPVLLSPDNTSQLPSIMSETLLPTGATEADQPSSSSQMDAGKEPGIPDQGSRSKFKGKGVEECNYSASDGEQSDDVLFLGEDFYVVMDQGGSEDEAEDAGKKSLTETQEQDCSVSVNLGESDGIEYMRLVLGDEKD